MNKRRRNQNEYRNIRPGSALQRGNVWVPVTENVKEKHEYWNSFTIAKTDKMFQEIETKFRHLSARRRSIGHTVSVTTPTELIYKKLMCRNSDSYNLTKPYPSGSCQTVLVGETSTFCVSSNVNGNLMEILNRKH